MEIEGRGGREKKEVREAPRMEMRIGGHHRKEGCKEVWVDSLPVKSHSSVSHFEQALVPINHQTLK